MSDAKADAVTRTTPDLLNTLAAIEPDSPLSELRSQRGDVMRYIQGSYDALLEPEDESGVSRIERGLIALRVALLTSSTTLLEHYRDYLTQLGASAEAIAEVEQDTPGEPLAERMLALLAHVDLLTNTPREATQAHLMQLQTHGFSTRDIVTVAQLIAFLTFQVRTLAGLQLLAEAL